MSDDIRPGDVVVCVDDLPHIPEPGWFPKLRCTYRVIEVFEATDYAGIDTLAVNLAEDPTPDPELGWPVFMFRKLNDEPEDVALTARIRACRPIKTKEPAQC